MRNAGHFVCEGTGFGENDSIDGVVGYEYDQAGASGVAPAGLTLLAESPVTDINGRRDVAHATIYQADSGAFVFVAGSNFSSWKLDDNDFRQAGADPRVQRITENLLAAMGARSGVRA